MSFDGRILSIESDVRLQWCMLEALARGELSLIEIRNAAPAALLEGLDVFAQQDASAHPTVAGLGIKGRPLYEVSTADDLNRYLQYGEAQRALLHRLAGGGVSMNDVLQRAWPAGLEPLMIEGRPAPTLILRLYDKGAGVIPHCDDLRTERVAGMFAVDPRPHQFLAQFGFNLFVRAPRRGGRLFLWDREPSTEERSWVPRTGYGIPWRCVLDPPSAIYEPRIGSLIILNTRLMHGVEDPEGDRITASGFVGLAKGKAIGWA